MPVLTHRRLLIGVPMVVLLLVAAGVFLLTRVEDLKARSARITVGMPREQVENLLGPPVLTLPRSAGGGRLGRGGDVLVWVDQFWQVDVVTGPDGLVESVGSMPSDSFYRRTLGRLLRRP
jgi:hypothetical protein